MLPGSEASLRDTSSVSIAEPPGDGIVSALQVLHALVRSDRTLCEARQGMSKYPQTLRNVRLAKRIDLDSDGALQDAIAAVEADLGTDGRVLLRVSGTEPIVRIHGRGRLARRGGEAGRPARRGRLCHYLPGTVNSGTDIHRQVFFVSDSTGITVETLGNALLSQFDHAEFVTTTIPFVIDAAARRTTSSLESMRPHAASAIARSSSAPSRIRHCARSCRAATPSCSMSSSIHRDPGAGAARRVEPCPRPISCRRRQGVL